MRRVWVKSIGAARLVVATLTEHIHICALDARAVSNNTPYELLLDSQVITHASHLYRSVAGTQIAILYPDIGA